MSDALRRRAFAAYEVPSPLPTFPAARPYEIDHLIPLGLGGTNDVENLWPEPADPRPGYHEKDLVEAAANRRFCGREPALDLTWLQNQMKTNWFDLGVELGVLTASGSKATGTGDLETGEVP